MCKCGDGFVKLFLSPSRYDDPEYRRLAEGLVARPQDVIRQELIPLTNEGSKLGGSQDRGRGRKRSGSDHRRGSK